jgi:hypothetical protein
MPAVVFVLILFCAWLASLFYKWKDPSWIAKRTAANPFERALSLYLAILAGMYIYILTIGLEPFRCLQQPDGTLTLVASPNLDCFDNIWARQWFSIGVGLTYIIGIPVLLLSTLWKNRYSIESNLFQWRFGLLTSSYKPKFYWWGIYLLSKKTIFVFLVDLTNDYSIHFRAFLVLVLLIGTLVIESLCRPWKVDVGISRYVNFGYTSFIPYLNQLKDFADGQFSQLCSF